VKLLIEGAALTSAAKWTAKLATTNSANPVMGGIRLVATGDVLNVSATDGNMFGSLTIPITVTEQQDGDGELDIIVSARLLHALTATIPATAKVTMWREGQRLTMRCGTLWRLPELAGADTWSTFPELGELLGTVDAGALSRAVSRVLPAVSTDEKAASTGITGVSCEIGSKLTLTATDRYRLASVEAEWNRAAGVEDQKIILSPSLLKIVTEDIGGTVKIYSDGNMIGFVSSPRQIIDRLMTGSYLKTWRTIFAGPEAYPSATVVVDVATLARVVAQVSAVVDTKTGFELLRLRFGPDEIGVSLASDADSDAGNDEDVEPVHWSGEPLTVGVTPRYLLDALSCLGSPMALLTFEGERKPFMLRPADKDGQVIPDGYGHVLVTRKPDAGTAS
jgi:DNA polymerase-3 subunit beta